MELFSDIYNAHAEYKKIPLAALKKTGGSNEPDLCDADQDGSIMFGIQKGRIQQQADL